MEATRRQTEVARVCGVLLGQDVKSGRLEASVQGLQPVENNCRDAKSHLGCVVL